MNIGKITKVGKAYRNFKRYEQILQVLFKFGFGDMINTLKLENFFEFGLNLFSGKDHKYENHSRPERVRLVLEELGPTFIKLGQVLSTRPDLIPLEYIMELNKLQDSVPSFPYEEVEQIISIELGKKPDELFKSFERESIAAASIGQVHRAVTLDGEEVVVKVQRPGIRQIIETDLEIMNHLAVLIENNIQELELQRPTAIVEEFARAIEKEIDYTIEASSAQRFATNFFSNPDVCVPHIFPELSSEKVLTMEYAEGVKISDLSTSPNPEQYDFKLIASRGADAVMEQIFVHGFFHADPHPGNIFILSGNRICFLDFGMMGRVSEQERHDFARLLSNIFKGEDRRILQGVLKFVYFEKDPDSDALQRDICDIIDQNIYRPMREIQLTRIFEQLMSALTANNLRLKPNLYIMLKSLITIEGIARKLDPDLEIITHLKPFVHKLRMAHLNPFNMLKKMVDPFEDMMHAIGDIPMNFEKLLEKAKKGNLKIEFEHIGLEPLLRTLERVSDHVAYAIVLASLIIGSSLIVLSKIPPHWNNIPVIGIVGFIISGLMGFRLLLFPRHGKKK